MSGSRSWKTLRKPEKSVPPAPGIPCINLHMPPLCTPYIVHDFIVQHFPCGPGLGKQRRVVSIWPVLEHNHFVV